MRSQLIRSMKVTTVALVAILSGVTTARADFQVEVSVDNGAFVLVPGVPLSTGGSIDITGLYGGVFSVVGHADSNSNTVASTGTIHITADVKQLDVDSGHTIDIIASDTNYVFPVGGHYNLNSSVSGTFSNTDSGDFEEYTGSAIKNPFPLFGQDVSNSTIHKDSILGGGSISGPSNTAAFDSPSQYGLTAALHISLQASVADPDDRELSIITSTIASTRAVPEPASIVLVGLGFVGTLGLIRQRRKTCVS
jgi:hypothetical protein